MILQRHVLSGPHQLPQAQSNEAHQKQTTKHIVGTP